MKEQYFLSYNQENIFKNLIQAEDHLKNLEQEGFNQCALKHLSFVEAEADEAVSHSMIVAPILTKKWKVFGSNAKEVRKEIQEGRAHPERTTLKVRKLRRQFESFNEDFDTSKCKSCGDIIGESKISSIKNLSKDLNTSQSFYDLADESVAHTNNSFEANQLNGNKNNMAKIDFAKVGYMTAGQFAAEGVKYLGETYPSTEPGKYEKYINLGGGALLTVLPMFVKLPKVAKDLMMVAGTNLIAFGAVKWIRETTAPPTGLRAGVARVAKANGGNNNMAFSTGAVGGTGKAYGTSWKLGGTTPKAYGGAITATNIPTEYARAGILSEAQQFSDPQHAGLIRVD